MVEEIVNYCAIFGFEAVVICVNLVGIEKQPRRSLDYYISHPIYTVLDFQTNTEGWIADRWPTQFFPGDNSSVACSKNFTNSNNPKVRKASLSENLALLITNGRLPNWKKCDRLFTY